MAPADTPNTVLLFGAWSYSQAARPEPFPPHTRAGVTETSSQDIYEPLRAITIKGKKGQSQCPGGPGASSTWRLPLRGTALSPGELPALWHHHLLVQSQDRGRAGAVRTIKSESPPAPPATSGPVAGDKKPPHGAEILRRASGLQATRWREEVKPHLPTRAMLPGNHRMDRVSQSQEAFPTQKH